MSARTRGSKPAAGPDPTSLEQRWSRLLLALFFLVPVGFAFLGSRGLYYRDHVLFFRPTWWSIYTQLRRLELPIINLWHPMGLPHEASTSFALFTPNTALLLLGPFERSYDLFVLSHFAVLCAGAFVLSRVLDLGRVPAMGVAVLLALAGPVISFENLLVGLQGLAYTPWLLAGLVVCRRRPGPYSAALLALGFGCAAQGIMPELFLLDALGGALVLGWPNLERVRRPALLSIGGGLLLGLVIASADLAPLLDALRGSERGAGFDVEVQEAWSLVPLQFLEFLIPSLWSLSELSGIAIPDATGVREPPYLTSLYLGISLPLALAAVSRQRRHSLALFAMMIFFVLVAMGPATPLHRWLSALPLLRNTRYPVKYILCALPCLAALLALGLRDLESRRPVLRAAALLHLLILLSIAVVFYTPSFERWIATTARPYASNIVFEYFRDGDPIAMALAALRVRLWPPLLFSIVLVFLLSTSRLRGSPWLGPALVTTLALDLFAGAGFAIMTASTEAERMSPPIQQAVQVPSARVFLGAVLPVPQRAGMSPFESATFSRGEVGQLGWTELRAFVSSDLEGLRSNPIQTLVQGAVEKLSLPQLHALFERAGVSRMISPAELDWPRLADARDVQGRSVSVYDIPTARPWVAAYPNWEGASSTSTGALERLLTAPVAGAALLWDAADVKSSRDTTACDPKTRIKGETSPDRIEVEVSSTCVALLVVQEVHRDRWKVEIDGSEARLLQAETGYLATSVPPGEHTVRFSYTSLFRAWLPVSLTGLALAAILLAFGWRRSRSPKSNPRSPEAS